MASSADVVASVWGTGVGVGDLSSERLLLDSTVVRLNGDSGAVVGGDLRNLVDGENALVSGKSFSMEGQAGGGTCCRLSRSVNLVRRPTAGGSLGGDLSGSCPCVPR